MDKKELIETLNNLLETCKDGEKGFNTCAEHLKQEELRVICRDRAKSCEQAANELKGLIQAQGGEPQERSSAAGALHRGWVDLRSKITDQNDSAVLKECERGEDVAVEAYQEALDKDLPDSVRNVIEKQYQGVKANHDKVKALRDTERAKA